MKIIEVRQINTKRGNKKYDANGKGSLWKIPCVYNEI